MNRKKFILKMCLFAWCTAFIFPSSFALETLPSKTLFQIVIQEFALDNTTIEAAQIVHPKNRLEKYQIIVKLKKPAAEQLKRMTEANIGKKLNLLISHKVISIVFLKTPLLDELLITGLTKQDMQQFVKNLST